MKLEITIPLRVIQTSIAFYFCFLSDNLWRIHIKPLLESFVSLYGEERRPLEQIQWAPAFNKCCRYRSVNVANIVRTRSTL